MLREGLKFIEGLYREHRLLYSLLSVLVMAGVGVLSALLTDILRGRVDHDPRALRARGSVGTSLAYILGQSVLASLRHIEFGHINLKIGLGLVGGMVVGTELGARLIEVLKRSGEVDRAVGALYIVFLGLVGVLTLRESWKGFPRSMRRFGVPPSSEGRTSLWSLFGTGAVVGAWWGSSAWEEGWSCCPSSYTFLAFRRTRPWARAYSL